MSIHFGVKVLPGKNGLKLTREKYALVNKRNTILGDFTTFKEAVYEDESCKTYTDEWCQKHRENCLQNFDLNMKFFEGLDHDQFNINLNQFVLNNKFVEITDLNLYEDVEGYYLMVLDEYSQMYIGTANNIKRRIRQHWSTSKEFDKLIFPGNAIKTSVISIDCFRSLDTTRIFVFPTVNTFMVEDEYMQQLPREYLLNRIGGGKLEGPIEKLNALSKLNKRNL